MLIFLKVGFINMKIGDSDIVNAFFSSIIGNLEPEGRGTRFPELTLELFDGELVWEKAEKAKSYLETIRKEMIELSVEDVVWDIDEPKKNAPENFLKEYKGCNLLEVFRNNGGRLLIECLEKQLDASIELEEKIIITNFLSNLLKRD